MSLQRVPLPVLVVSPSSRYLGLVCMNGALEILDVRRHHLRLLKDESAKVETLRVLLASALQRSHPAALVIECESHAPSSPVHNALVAAVEAVGREAGCAVLRMTFQEACRHIDAHGSAAKVGAILAERFPLLQRQLGADAALTLKHKDRRRVIRPILAALAIAFAIVRDAVVKEGCR